MKNANLKNGTFYLPTNVGATRMRSNQPIAYRLMQKTGGTLVLQGAFYWTEGNNGGHDWEDIPTIIEVQEK